MGELKKSSLKRETCSSLKNNLFFKLVFKKFLTKTRSNYLKMTITFFWIIIHEYQRWLKGHCWALPFWIPPWNPWNFHGRIQASLERSVGYIACDSYVPVKLFNPHFDSKFSDHNLFVTDLLQSTVTIWLKLNYKMPIKTMS